MTRLGAWPRRLAIALAVLLALWALAWLAVPPLLKSQAQSRLSDLLGRSVSIGAVDFRPWSLELTVSDVAIGPAPGGTQPLLKLARAYVDADAGSLWRRAPVIAALELDGLDLKLARTSPGHYDIDDLLARFAPDPAAPPAKPAEPQRFALYNLQLRDAAFSFDDRPVGRVHKLDAVQVSLPFLSNLPAHLEVTAQPHVAFRLNGAAFDSGAQATPFAARRKGELKLAFADLDLAGYAGYLPASLPLRLQKGALSADLALRFELPEGGRPEHGAQRQHGAAQPRRDRCRRRAAAQLAAAADRPARRAAVRAPRGAGHAEARRRAAARGTRRRRAPQSAGPRWRRPSAGAGAGGERGRVGTAGARRPVRHGRPASISSRSTMRACSGTMRRHARPPRCRSRR